MRRSGTRRRSTRRRGRRRPALTASASTEKRAEEPPVCSSSRDPPGARIRRSAPTIADPRVRGWADGFSRSPASAAEAPQAIWLRGAVDPATAEVLLAGALPPRSPLRARRRRCSWRRLPVTGNRSSREDFRSIVNDMTVCLWTALFERRPARKGQPTWAPAALAPFRCPT